METLNFAICFPKSKNLATRFGKLHFRERQCGTTAQNNSIEQ